MREILFRGKFAGWKYGDLSIQGDRYYIDTRDCMKYEVNAATVGQYTDKEDKHGEKIFEGDILRTYFDCDGETIVETYKVYWDDELSAFSLASDLCDETDDLYIADTMTRIGNIYDTPELWHPYKPSEGGDA